MKKSFFLTIVGIIFIVIYLMPIFWMASSSFKIEKDIYSLKWLPSKLYFGNYIYILEKSGILRWTFNSFVVAVSITGGVILLSAFAAYSLGRLEFPGRRVLFYFTLGGLMIPIQAIMIPRYLLLKEFNILNTYRGLILPGVAFPMHVLILSQFFKGIPREFEDVARIDGANELQILFRIMLPLAKPALLAVAVFTFTFFWNDFLWPLIVATSEEMYTLPVGLATFYGTYTLRFGVTMAGNVIASLPIVIFFLIFQKQLIEGITLGGLKE